MKAKNALYAVLSVLLLLALQTAPAVAGEEGECPIGAYVEVWNSGSLVGLDAVVSGTVKRHLNSETMANNLDELKAYITDFRSRFPDVVIKINEAFFNKDKSKSVACWTCSATHKATTKPVKFSGMSVVHWVDGKVAEEWVVFESAELNKQLGYTITPPPELKEE